MPSQAPDHPNLEVVKQGHKQCKQRKTFCFTKLSSEVNYAVYNNSLSTIERAIKERVFFIKKDGEYTEPTRPTRAQFSMCVADFEVAIKKHVSFTNPMQAEQFAMSYQARRRTIYLNAIKENETLGFNDKLANVKAFVKCEKYNFTKKIDPVPRIIQPRDPRYIVETGRYIKPIEKKIYKAIDTIFHSKTVFKGMNASDRGRAIKATWDEFNSPVAIGLDAERFDQRVSNEALKWEHSIYGKYYPRDKYFRRLMRLQRNNKCGAKCAEGFIKYRTMHNRMSGDSNTSLGNVTIMCAIVYGLFTYLGVKARLINDGDDCVLFVEKEHEELLSRNIDWWFSTAGFKVVTEKPVYVLEKVEFCQSYPILGADGQYLMVRDPRVCISKDLVAIKPLDNKKLALRWLAAVGEGGQSLSSGIPVMQEFYTCLKRNSGGAKALSDPTLEGGFQRLSAGMNYKYTKISPETRYSFWLAFGITPSEQVALEDYYIGILFTSGSIRDRFEHLPL